MRGPQRDGAVDGEGQNHHRGADDPDGLDPGVAVNGRPVGVVALALPPDDQRIAEIDQHQDENRR